MKKIMFILVAVGVVTAMAGCKETEPVQTVEWYKTHKTEREETLKKCEDNPGELQATPNCINANDARQKLIWGSRKGIKLVPLTAKEMGLKK